MYLFFTVITFVLTLSVINANDKIKLSDLQVLTLNYGRMTNGRRSQPVPQLECTGGSAKCNEKYLPRVVQCKNMGSDGYDVQWKCQAELGSNLKFGQIDVNCEGYDYPNDKFVLKGSCGLRYTLDISGKSGGSYYKESNSNFSSSNGIYFLLFCVIVCVLVYVFCLSPSTNSPDGSYTYGSSAPPPPGFRSEYTEPPSYQSIFRNKNTAHGPGNTDGPGFWTGLGAGGLMGYLFGSRNTYQTAYHQPSTSYSVPHSGWRDSDYSHTTHRAYDRDESPDYRTASGYGGTSRR